MKLRPATAEEVRSWDSRILTNADGGDLLQTTFFAEQKRENGWIPRYMVYQGERLTYTLYLVKKIYGLGQLWYSPKGPGVGAAGVLPEVAEANAAYARTDGRIFVFKLEPEVPAGSPLPASFVSVKPIQPNVHTIIVDLSLTEEEIFAGFRQRGRRSIRKAEKQGITVERRAATPETMRLMYTLYAETSERGGFYLRDYDYYERFWSSAAERGYGSFHFALKDGEPVAGIFVTHFGAKGLYKDGASSQAVGNSGAAHLLQWEVMKALKAQGVTSYDLHTTPPPEAMEDKEHPSYGLGQFKSGFSNEIVSYIGAVDQPVRPIAYRVWQVIGERLTHSLVHRLHHRIYF